MTAPEPLLLLYTDASDPVARVLLQSPGLFPRPVIALSLDALTSEVVLGDAWSWRGTTIDPSRTIVVNRLVRAGDAAFADRQLWRWLTAELPRFTYASALPTATALHGDFGTLLDQWLDVPALVPGLRTPDFRRPWETRMPTGDLHRADPRQLYSFGKPVDTPASPDATLLYARPRGHLVHVAQVGGLLLPGPVPPSMTRDDQSAIVAFANTLAARSDVRILEHAFFVGDGPPVFFSTCPVPVITSGLPDFQTLLVRGLEDDIQRRRHRAAA